MLLQSVYVLEAKLFFWISDIWDSLLFIDDEDRPQPHTPFAPRAVVMVLVLSQPWHVFCDSSSHSCSGVEVLLPFSAVTLEPWDSAGEGGDWNGVFPESVGVAAGGNLCFRDTG